MSGLDKQRQCDLQEEAAGASGSTYDAAPTCTIDDAVACSGTCRGLMM